MSRSSGDEDRPSRRLPDADGDSLRLAREALIERQIREAREAGAFDDLPFRGERIPLADDSAAGDWALAHHILKNAHMVPPWIATDREVRDLLDRRDTILARAQQTGQIGRERERNELKRVVEAANRAIAILNSEAPTDRQHRRRLNVDAELAALDRAHRS
jgi:DnaJ homologue, subfamily C, member 28, conserved domain